MTEIKIPFKKWYKVCIIYKLYTKYPLPVIRLYTQEKLLKNIL